MMQYNCLEETHLTKARWTEFVVLAARVVIVATVEEIQVTEGARSSSDQPANAELPWHNLGDVAFKKALA